MNVTPLDNSLLELLQRVDTPTVCNAIEVAQGKRGFDAFTRKTMLSSEPASPAMVGYACTAKISALLPPVASPDVVRQKRMAYFEHMASAPVPSIAVIEDTDYPECVGAWWGEVHTAVHKGLGIKGALTNGAMRDLGDLAPDFPVLAGSISPSHAFVHVKELGTPVNILGMAVKHGDLVHADRHGALVVPVDVIGQLEEAIAMLFSSEKLILEPAREPGFNMEKLAIAWKAFEQSRT